MRIAFLESAVAERDVKLAERDAQLVTQAEQLAVQAERLAKLTALVAKLTERFGAELAQFASSALQLGTQSERGERFAERVMTVARTARKQGKAVLDFMDRSVRAYIDGTTAPRLLSADLVA